MNTLLSSRSAILLVALASMSAASPYSAADDLAKWSRKLSTEYLHASSVQIASTNLAVQSPDGWFAHLAGSSEESDIGELNASANAWSAVSGMQITPAWSVAFGIDKWQGDQSVGQQSIIATVGYSADSWSLFLSYRQRELRIEGRARNGAIRKHFETFDGGELRYIHYFSNLLSLDLSYTNYQSNPGAVFRAIQQRPDLLAQLGDHSFGLVSGQAANTLYLALNLQFQDWYISVQANAADNYFNDANSTGLNLYVERNITHNLAIGTEAGVQSSDDSDSSTFFSIAAHFSW